MKLKLLDRSGTIIGEISVVSENGIVLGDFLPMTPFSEYASLFKSFEQAANDQLLVEVDRLEKEIHALDFCVLDSHNEITKKISDLQIMGDGISFHWRRY